MDGGGTLLDGGFVVFAQVSSGGTFFDSGAAYHTEVDSGAVMYVDPAGKARGSVIDSGGIIYDGGTVNRTRVNEGGVLYVGGPVTVSGVTSEFVGSANWTVLRGGTEYVVDGTDTHTRIGNGGVENVESGGTAKYTTIHNGGELIVSSGGVADKTVIDRGGSEFVMSGGVASGAVINRGGTLEFDSGSTQITQDIRFGDRGAGVATLKFDAAATTSAALIYDGVICGFDSPKDKIDLAGLGFVSGQTSATAVLSGSNTIVTVTNGTNAVDLTLKGDRTSDSFAVANDGSGGTVVTDQTPAWDSFLGALRGHIESAASDLGDLKSGFNELFDQIKNWDNLVCGGSTSTSSFSPDHSSPLSSLFDAGWHSHLIQVLASFGDDKGGPSQERPIQGIEQALQGILTVPNHA